MDLMHQTRLLRARFWTNEITQWAGLPSLFCDDTFPVINGINPAKFFMFSFYL